jgi:uncharacterized repeat protein (TIGR03803 family)
LSLTRKGTWQETILHTFVLDDLGDGGHPQGSLIFDAAGNLYGTTWIGGNQSCSAPVGCGIVFKLTPKKGGGNWTETVVHTFTGFDTDGASPRAGLVRDGSGNFYGTTLEGGDSTSCGASSGCGTVFELTPAADGSWTETVLHNFTGPDGSAPDAGLTFDDSDSHLYGTTTGGGKAVCIPVPGTPGCGTVFEVTP